MRLISRLRPSPSMIVALIALFLAAGGVGYAAVTINGKVLKNRSVAGKKIKKNTLTGTEIKESKLGKVPSAKNADHATSADSAGFASTTGGVSTVSLHATKTVAAAADFASAPAVPLG